MVGFFFSHQKKKNLKKIPKHVCGTCVVLYPYWSVPQHTLSYFIPH